MGTFGLHWSYPIRPTSARTGGDGTTTLGAGERSKKVTARHLNAKEHAKSGGRPVRTGEAAPSLILLIPA